MYKEISVEDQMSFWEHLDAFRKVLFKIIAYIIVLTLILFVYMPDIFNNLILSPSRADFFLYSWLNNISGQYPIIPDFCLGSFHVKIININLASQFLVHISTSFWFGLVLSFPFVMYQLFSFIKPALYRKERKNTAIAFFFGNLLFFIGISIGYLLVFPLTLRFLAGYELSRYIENSVSLDSYIDSFLLMCFVMGLVFELPILSWLLSKLGVLNRSFFYKYRRHAIIILLIAAAIITPSSDPFTLMVVFIPIYILWEISAVIVQKENTSISNNNK